MNTKLRFTDGFELGDARLVLVKPAELKGQELKQNSEERLKQIFSSLQEENYSVETPKQRRLARMNGKINPKARLKELNQEIDFDSGIIDNLHKARAEVESIVDDYKEHKKDKKRIINNYAEEAEKPPLSDATLLQGGEKLPEVDKTTDYLENLLDKESELYRAVEREESVIDFIKDFAQQVGQWKNNKDYDLRTLKKQSYYKILVCPIIADFLDTLTEFLASEDFNSMGQKLDLAPGNAVIIHGKGFKKELQITIPVELQGSFQQKPFKLTCRA